jgi:methyltransferase-like protein/ubiquinone/menaquinone biosynthesis C-methylase UbiE
MENPYNLVAYQSSPFPQAHISRLASRGVLMGMKPPELKGCRVLELGCGDGSHLIPMAMQFPEALFVGIDLAETPIARAEETAAELGLDNVSFRVSDVMQLSGQPGECDYLIAHGLYSWVPAAVQEKIMELCARLLADRGIAYISYNCYPAWHVREMTRNMSRIHTEGVSDAAEIRSRTIALLAAIYRTQGEREPYREAIRAEMERIIAKEAFLCFHDDFGEHNLPVYFSEFVRRAAAQGLQFLSESDLTDFESAEFAPETREALGQIADPVQREQFYDFLVLRGFRRTLLCRNEIVLDRAIPLDALKALFYSAQLKCSSPAPDLVTFAPFEFETITGASVTVNQPFVKVVLYELTQAWPGTMTFSELLTRARSVAPLLSIADAEAMLREVLLRVLIPGILDVSTIPWQYPVQPTEKPVASRLARLQLRNGNMRVTSLRHRAVDLDNAIGRAVLPLLDGSRDHAQLAAGAAAAVGRELDADEVDQALRELSDLSLLVE